MISIAKYISNKTLATLMSSFATMLPKALKASYKTNVNKKYISYLKINRDLISEVKTDKQKEVINLFKEKVIRTCPHWKEIFDD